MQRVKNLCIGIFSCIFQYFQSQKDEYQNRMIELEERLNQVKNPPQLKQQQQSVFTDISPNQPNIGSTCLLLSPPDISQQLKQPLVPKRVSNISRDSFYSLNSGISSSQSISRRTFKIVRSVHGLKIGEEKEKKEEQFKQFTSDNQYFNNDDNLERRSQSQEFGTVWERLAEWNEKQYQMVKENNNFQMTTTEKSKIESNIFLDEAINKLEDYYTFYFHEIDRIFIQGGKKEDKQLTASQGWMFRKTLDFKCFYHRQNQSVQNNDQTVMMVISFKCNTSNTLQFLKWYNAQSTQAKLYDFKKMKLVENGVHPILEVEQYGMQLKQKTSYLLMRQTEVVKFDNDPDCEYILQLDTTFRRGKYFKSLLRFQHSENSLVEIYCQTCVKLSTSIEAFYTRKWQQLQRMIQKKSLKLSSKGGSI